MTRRWRVGFLGLVLMWACPRDAAAKHYNLGGFVPAYVSCTEEMANAHTTNGIAACAPAIPVSNCETDPDTALRLSPRLRSAFTYRNTGRRETVANGRKVDILSRVVIKGVETCDAQPFTGSIDVQATARVVEANPACAAGTCVLPDFSWRHALECVEGECTLAHGKANDALAAEGMPPLPSHEQYTMRFARFAVLDRAGRLLATTGLQMGKPVAARTMVASSGTSFVRRLFDPFGVLRTMTRSGWLGPRSAYAYEQTTPRIAGRLLSRYVQAYSECIAENADASAGGPPACASVPLSNCATDPENAVVAVVPHQEHTREGRGKFRLRIHGRSLRILGQVEGLRDCEGTFFNGTLPLRGIGQVTLNDPACGGGLCTTVDVPFFETRLQVADGGVSKVVDLPLSDLGPFPGPATYATFDVRALQLLDGSGNVALEGPSTLVRCNPAPQGEEPFCYGN